MHDRAQRALKRANVANDMTVARNGVEALNYLFGPDGRSGCPQSELPVVILLDLKLPKVGGMEVLQRIRKDSKTKHIPVVVLTSSDEQRDIVESYKLGANSYIRKPVVFTDFVEAVRQLGLYWLVLNKPA